MLRTKTILLVDDEVEFAEMIQMRLEANEYAVLLAHDGKAGLEIARKEKPDAILLDVMMPVMDGFKALRELRRDATTWDIPVIMLTAKGETSSIMRAQESGAVDYLIKPLDSQKMLEILKKHAQK